MEPKTLTIPTVHLNGTSRKELLNQVLQARSAVCTAMEKLTLAAPNQRDYVQTPDAWRSALNEHHTRMYKLREVADELEEIAEKLLPQ